MADLSVKIAGVEFKNPIIAASGTIGFGREYSEFYPLSVMGGISCKGITLKERLGNPAPRIAETPSGILNAVGLQNPGVEHFINEDLGWLKQQGTVVIANIAGNTYEEYCSMAEKLSDTDVDMIELNISCPNVKSGGVQFGTSCESVGAITKAVRKYCKKPLIIKHTQTHNKKQYGRTFRSCCISCCRKNGVSDGTGSKNSCYRNGRHFKLERRCGNDDCRCKCLADRYGSVQRPLCTDKNNRGYEQIS